MKKVASKKTAIETEEVPPVKIKKEKEFDFEGHEVIVPDKVVDPDAEETVADPLAESEALEDEVELDEEEINPFKDKWEE